MKEVSTATSQLRLQLAEQGIATRRIAVGPDACATGSATDMSTYPCTELSVCAVRTLGPLRSRVVTPGPLLMIIVQQTNVKIKLVIDWHLENPPS